ncbi:CorA family divalent cation transporter [Nocardia arizonensis]|uniref:CorA family divalent cation transporter n=1 Tax=Nocardia arizonensis TaxID=1141647 RepID=UPI00138EDB1E|nr:CorA family divalent cation transporter [Nocardia arizonensis]
MRSSTVFPPAEHFDTEVLGKHWIPLSASDTETAAELRVRLGVDFVTGAARGESDDFIYLPVVVNFRRGEVVDCETIVFALGEQFVVTLQPSEPFEPFDGAIVKMGRKPLLTASSRGVMYALLWSLNQESDRVLHAESRALAAIRAKLDAASADRRAFGGVEIRQALAGMKAIEEIISRIRDSQRHLARAARHLRGDIGLRSRELDAPMEGLMADIDGVTAYALLEHDKVRYALESLRTSLDVERNRIIKVLTTVTAVFLGPTLVLTLYGVNSGGLPEWEYGVLVASLVAVVAVVVGLVYVTRKGGPR